METQPDNSSVAASDFSFAFDNTNFSDRLLRIEITNIADWDDRTKPTTMCHQQYDDDQSPGGKILCSWSIDTPPAVRARTIHANSAILAAKSPFFYKLFSNGMRESEQRDVTLRVSCSEEEAFMDLLQFMYCGTLNAQTATALLDVLLVADKFQVVSCMHHCTSVLQTKSMTLESASLFIGLPSSVLMDDTVQPLIKAAKEFLRKQFGWIGERHMNLSLAVIEEVLSSNGLQVLSEDNLYDFVLRWAKRHYPNDEERREVLNNKLHRLIRFPQMTNAMLQRILQSDDLDCLCALKLVAEALIFKTEHAQKRKHCTSEDILRKGICERFYAYKPIRVMEFDAPHMECMVFWNIKQDEFLTSKSLQVSECFHLGDHPFNLVYYFTGKNRWYLLLTTMVSKDKLKFAVESQFSVREKPSGNFAVTFNGLLRYSGKTSGSINLLSEHTSLFMSEDCPYIIDNVIHLRAVFTVRP